MPKNLEKENRRSRVMFDWYWCEIKAGAWLKLEMGWMIIETVNRSTETPNISYLLKQCRFIDLKHNYISVCMWIAN